MLIYGDPQFQTTFGAFVRRLRAAAAGVGSEDLDGLRAILIQAGQLEQGSADHTAIGEGCQRKVRHLTDTAARAFCHAWMSAQGRESPAPRQPSDFLATLGSEHCDRFELTIKVPEGFEFYRLYPEQYAAAAEMWMAEKKATGSWDTSRRVLVVGVRSIGTTLSAIVTAVLQYRGVPAERLTVRPGGNPFTRCVDLGPILPKYGAAIVVDEGPGMSGSSMASVACALEEAGLRDITLFPGHSGGPGTAATPELREVWARLPQVLAPLEEVRFSTAAGIHQLLVARTGDSGGGGTNMPPLDMTGGRWREIAYSSDRDWPAVASIFERTKILCAGRTERILWKFAGLGALGPEGNTLARQQFARQERLSATGLVPRPLDCVHGFIGSEWIDGARLGPGDASPSVLERLGEYLVAGAEPPLPRVEVERSKERLVEMVRCNLAQALGPAAAEAVATLGQELPAGADVPRYGDGRMAPHEWVRAGDGHILKTDCAGHEWDHTFVGPQPVWWDVAGTLVEWRLDRAEAGLLFEVLGKHGIACQKTTLRFYSAAYVAFKLGLFWAAEGQGLDSSERRRQAGEKARLLELVSRDHSAGQPGRSYW